MTILSRLEFVMKRATACCGSFVLRSAHIGRYPTAVALQIGSQSVDPSTGGALMKDVRKESYVAGCLDVCLNAWMVWGLGR